jgi:hypothetical protein
MDDDAHSPLDDPCFLLGVVAGELEGRGLSARDLVAITFTDGREQIAVSTRLHPLPQRYPELAEILDDVGRTCRDEGIAVEQLQRITFFEDEVNMETDDKRGGTDIFTWPILPASLHS